MPPGEDHENEFIQDVRVGYVEVVFKGGYRNVAIELDPRIGVSISSQPGLHLSISSHVAYILFHILLPSCHCRLADLESHLGRGIVHDPPEPGGICPTTTLHR